jgi:O-antigen ligase
VATAAAVVRDRRVVDILVLAVVGAALLEVAEAWLAWWGGADAAAPMNGTFYWYNPFAVFLIPGATVGLWLWLTRRGVFATLGLVGFALGSIGLVYSTSRASDACYAAAIGLVCAARFRQARVAALGRALIGLGAAAASVYLIAGPPFFSHRALPFAGTSSRAATQSLGQNGGYRLHFWREALGVFRRHPLVGGGFHSLATLSVGHVASGSVISPMAHNGYLQVLSDGGLVLGVPFLLGCAAIAWYVLSGLARSARRREYSAEALVLPIVLGALMVHSAVDFDWSFAADLMLAAVLGGVVAGRRWAAADRVRQPRTRDRTTAAVALVGIVLLGVAAVTAWSGDPHENLSANHISAGVSAR